VVGADPRPDNSEHKYSLYFDVLESKISEYSVLPENTYNMDEKGFMIGQTKRAKGCSVELCGRAGKSQVSGHDRGYSPLGLT
jgi:hypothetical protein